MKIVLGGHLYLGLGYIQAMLAEHGYPVQVVPLNNELLPFHVNNIESKNLESVLLKTLKCQEYRGLSLLLVNELGGLSALNKVSRQKLCTALNKIITKPLYKYKQIQDKEILLMVKRKKTNAANKLVVQKIYAGLLKNLQETCFYFLEDKLSYLGKIVLGLQLLTDTRAIVFSLIERIHDKYPHIQIVVGGIHATCMYEQVLMEYPYVIVIIGDGEYPFLELVQCIDNNKDWRNVAGLAYSQNGVVFKTSEPQVVDDLDKLYFPDHALAKLFDQDHLCLLTARGCPFNCSFCCSGVMSHNRIRYRSIANVMAELEFIREKYPLVHSIAIIDDTFLVDTARVIRFCEEVIKRKMKFKFVCLGRVGQLTRELVLKMERAGFTKIEFGLESANEKILQAIHKKITQTDILYTVRLLAESTIQIEFFLIVGLPGETWKTLRETGRFFQKLQKIKYIFMRGVNIAAAYPGTELYSQMKQGKFDLDSFWVENHTDSVWYTREHEQKTLFLMQQELQRYVDISMFFSWQGFWRQWPIIIFSKDRKMLLKYLLSQWKNNKVGLYK